MGKCTFHFLHFTHYLFRQNFQSDSSSSRRKINEESCHVCIFLSFAFHKSTWLQGTIESNTRAEMLSIYELWLDCANDYIRRSIDRKHSSSQSLAAYSHSLNHFSLSNNQLSTAALQLQISSTTNASAAPTGSHPTPLSQSSKAPSLAHSVSESALGPCDSNDRNYVNETREKPIIVIIYVSVGVVFNVCCCCCF